MQRKQIFLSIAPLLCLFLLCLFQNCADVKLIDPTGDHSGGSGCEGSDCDLVINTFVPKIAVGAFNACAVTNSGQVKCWGMGYMGTLGNGQLPNSSTAVTVSGLSNIQQVTIGFDHACALRNDGKVFCWGSNAYGQLGATTTDLCSGLPTPCTKTPLLVNGLPTVVQITANDFHTCAITVDKKVFCWGNNAYGELGATTTSMCAVPTTATPYSVPCSRVPVQVSGISEAAQITGGQGFACALLNTNTVKCWGSGIAVGNGMGLSNSPPLEVNGINNAVFIAAGNASNVCVVTSDKKVKCWGDRLCLYVFGGGSACAGDNSDFVYELPGVSNVKQISLGRSLCFTKVDGSLQCLGRNDAGTNGDGTTTASANPVSVLQMPLTAQVAAGDGSCAVNSAGLIKCWGPNVYGQLGATTTTVCAPNYTSPCSSTPVSVIGAPFL